MRITSLFGWVAVAFASFVAGGALRAEEVEKPAVAPRVPDLKSGEPAALPEKPAAPAETARAGERWKLFREHVEKLGRKDLLPEEAPGSKPPSLDAIVGILYRLSPDLAAAQDLLTQDTPDPAGARARLAKLGSTEDPYLAEYARLFGAQCDLQEKKYPQAKSGFEAVLSSKAHLASTPAHRGLAESYRGMGETTFEVLELRFLIAGLPPEGTADRGWAEERLAEIRRDHPGPLEDSAKRMRDLSGRLVNAGGAEQVRGDQAKVEDILEKVAKLLEDEAKRCPLCMSMACKACKKCGACTASGKCEGEHTGPGLAKGSGKGKSGDPKNLKRDGGPAARSTVAQDKPGPKNLRDSSAKDSDAWGSINEREVAKAMQDIWGKIPPSYRQVVAQYFKDIAGLKPAEGSQK